MFGFGRAVILKLINDIVKPDQHCLYFNNFFTSYNLLNALEKMNIYATDTTRNNRFANPPLPSDKKCLN